MRPPPSDDAAVAATNDDAQVSKLSAVAAGYFADPWLAPFVRRPARRPPLINLGYFVRHAVYTDTIASFLAAVGSTAQIVSLGAGYDTRPFRLGAAAAGAPPPLARYVELDLAPVVARKAAIIQRTPALAAAVGLSLPPPQPPPPRGTLRPSPPPPSRLTTPWYALMPADLRDVASVTSALTGAGIDWTAPTLVLAECVLVYLPPAAVTALVAELGRSFTDAAALVFEQVRPDDAFGRQMMQNVAARGCPLLGLAVTRTLADHEARFTDAGWGEAAAVTMGTAYDAWIPREERERADAVERLDEIEEWRLLLDHYAFVTAATAEAGGGVAGRAVVRR